jgi:hypothetical protein
MKGGVHMSKSRLIFIAVMLVAVSQALLAALFAISAGVGLGFYEGGGK